MFKCQTSGMPGSCLLFVDANIGDSSFLPQDKVSEFAAMTPQQLLRETQRAAGDERLTAWHDTLVNTGRDLKLVQEASFALRYYAHDD